MKTNEKIFLAQMALFILLLLPLTTIVSGCQKNGSVDLDVTESQWELLLIAQNNVEFHKPNDIFQNPDAYTLRFESDSTFFLNFSINAGFGNYRIRKFGEIEIHNYDNITRAAMTEFDEKVLNELKFMTLYTVKGKVLTLNGKDSKIEFKLK